MAEVRSVSSDLFLIFSSWSILIATMLVLQALGLDFGFEIWPIGEFRNWLEFLQDGPGSGAAKLFWTVDHRNALSPWWYLAARPLIDAVPAAPLILHLLIGLFVGVTAYLLMAELTRSRSFALSVGILSALFIPNAYRDQVIWNFIGALGCTLLSIWLFALFCKDRRRNGYLAGSFLAWFVALGTYTIQIGAMGGIFFLIAAAAFSRFVAQCHCGRRVGYPSLCRDPRIVCDDLDHNITRGSADLISFAVFIRCFSKIHRVWNLE